MAKERGRRFGTVRVPCLDYNKANGILADSVRIVRIKKLFPC